MAFCSNCGNKLSDSSKFCADCGQPIDGNTSNQKEVENEIEFGNMIIPPKSNENNKSAKYLIWILGIVVIIVLSYFAYESHQRKIELEWREYRDDNKHKGLEYMKRDEWIRQR